MGSVALMTALYVAALAVAGVMIAYGFIILGAVAGLAALFIAYRYEARYALDKVKHAPEPRPIPRTASQSRNRVPRALR